MTMKDSWYSFLPKKTHMHEWSVMDFAGFAYEWCVFTLYIQGYQRIFARFLLLNCLQA